MSDIWFTSDQHYGHGNIINYCDRPFGDTQAIAAAYAATRDKTLGESARAEASIHLKSLLAPAVTEMEETMIANHNACVKPGDRVFMLGDFGMGRQDHLPSIFDRLNGQRHILWGNHDKDKRFKKHVEEHAAWAGDYLRLRVGDERIILFHYAIEEWDGCHKGYWHLHGHSHGTRLSPAPMRRLDVGVDSHNFRPISFEEVRQYMTDPSRGSTDHHTGR